MYSWPVYLDLRRIFTSRGTLVFTFALIYHADEERRSAYRANATGILFCVRSSRASRFSRFWRSEIPRDYALKSLFRVLQP